MGTLTTTRRVALPFGLWDQAEARHAGQAPMKKVRSREDWERLRSILWGRYASHREVRNNWHERNGLDEITVRYVPADEAGPWTPMKEIFVTSGKQLVMPDA